MEKALRKPERQNKVSRRGAEDAGIPGLDSVRSPFSIDISRKTLRGDLQNSNRDYDVPSVLSERFDEAAVSLSGLCVRLFLD